jgi:hypothetical protein
MSALLNTYALRQTRVRSASIGVLGVIVHPMASGQYFGAVFQDERRVAEILVHVDAKHPLEQVDIDLAELTVPQDRTSTPLSYTLKDGGHLVAYCSWGRGGYRVHLSKADEKQGKSHEAFDSRSLQPGDLFVATLLRPGTYEVADELNKGTSTVRVAYPATGKMTLAPAPIRVAVANGKFEPSKLEVQSTQPIVFAVGSKVAAISIRLVEPDDGPRRKDEPARVHTAPRRSNKKSGEQE